MAALFVTIGVGTEVVSRAAERRSVDKLRRAGADEAISPYGLSGRRMALLAVQPSVLEALDRLDFGPDIRLEEVAVQTGTRLQAMTIAEAAHRTRTGRHLRPHDGLTARGRPR
ncbi:hypothetical protein ABZ746_22900 [Streptomyces sp. NPDC020096]